MWQAAARAKNVPFLLSFFSSSCIAKHNCWIELDGEEQRRDGKFSLCVSASQQKLGKRKFFHPFLFILTQNLFPLLFHSCLISKENGCCLEIAKEWHKQQLENMKHKLYNRRFPREREKEEQQINNTKHVKTIFIIISFLAAAAHSLWEEALCCCCVLAFLW